jgi:hypothetical protein
MPPSAPRSDSFESRRALLGRLHQHGEDIKRMTTGLDDAALDRRFDPEKWSLKELVCHLWRIQQLFEQRIDLMLETDVPVFASYTPEGDPAFETLVASSRGTESVQAFHVDRERFAGRLSQLSAVEWWRQGRHPTFGTFDIDFLIEYMVHHEAHHVYQMFVRRIPVVRWDRHGPPIPTEGMP